MSDILDTINKVGSFNVSGSNLDSEESKESLFKQTQDLISTLGDEQLKKVYVFTVSLLEEDNPFKPVTKGSDIS